jgi:hypothetical protein
MEARTPDEQRARSLRTARRLVAIIVGLVLFSVAYIVFYAKVLKPWMRE